MFHEALPLEGLVLERVKRWRRGWRAQGEPSGHRGHAEEWSLHPQLVRGQRVFSGGQAGSDLILEGHRQQPGARGQLEARTRGVR